MHHFLPSLGLLASLMYCASVCGGICNYFQFRILQYLYSKLMIRFRHNFFGIITYTLGYIAILFGYFTNFGVKNLSPPILISLIVCNCIVYLLTLIGAIQSLYRKWILLQKPILK